MDFIAYWLVGVSFVRTVNALVPDCNTNESLINVPTIFTSLTSAKRKKEKHSHSLVLVYYITSLWKPHQIESNEFSIFIRKLKGKRFPDLNVDLQLNPNILLNPADISTNSIQMKIDYFIFITSAKPPKRWNFRAKSQLLSVHWESDWFYNPTHNWTEHFLCLNLTWNTQNTTNSRLRKCNECTNKLYSAVCC